MRNLIVAIALMAVICAYHFTVIERNYIKRADLAVVDTDLYLEELATAVYEGQLTSDQFKSSVEHFRNGLESYRAAGYIVFSARSVAAGVDNDITGELK
ncbi:MAG: hypothetical protein AB7E48_00975 [Deferribacterales bacterium]